MFFSIFFLGNALYCFASNPCLLIVSRLITGIGTGPGSGITRMLSCATLKQEQTSKISLLLFFLKIGLVVAPLCYMVLRNPILNFWIGEHYINKYTLPTVSIKGLHSTLDFFIFVTFKRKQLRLHFTLVEHFGCHVLHMFIPLLFHN